MCFFLTTKVTKYIEIIFIANVTPACIQNCKNKGFFYTDGMTIGKITVYIREFVKKALTMFITSSIM
ncbi:hypothetical protein HMPREF3033_01571 [Veillonellaceae bacterium DNF00751]|nr:hypothetical protein HMPREF3033_01571 [Veillonellaceae bacterium DNF00751]